MMDSTTSGPHDPTVAEIAEALALSYLPEGIVIWMAAHKDQFDTAYGRRRLWEKAQALADGAFT